MLVDPDTPLRADLQRMTSNRDLAAQQLRLEALRTIHGHTIKRLPSRGWKTESNCIMYALGLRHFTPKTRDASGRWLADTGLLHHLVEKGGLAESPRAVATHVIYFSTQTLKEPVAKHIGLWLGGDRVKSKWGYGWVYAHGLWEVPSSYGDDARFFRAALSPDMLERMIETYFIAEKGAVQFGRGRTDADNE